MHQSESREKRVNHCLEVFSRDLEEFREQPVSWIPGRGGGDEGTSEGLKYAE